MKFALQMEGNNYDVYFTIHTGSVDHRIRAIREGSEWTAVVPKSLSLEVGEYDFSIDVVMDNHIYPATAAKLTVKSPIKASAAIVETAKTTAAPAVKFLGVKPPKR